MVAVLNWACEVPANAISMTQIAAIAISHIVRRGDPLWCESTPVQLAERLVSAVSLDRKL
jgi:hypothetical protein